MMKHSADSRPKVTSVAFPSLNATAQEEAKQNIDEGFQVIRDLAPDSGAYVNEAFLYEKDWQQTFWGDNYDRLLKIKREVDPMDVFWCLPCVGNEHWEVQSSGQLCRVG